MTAAPTNAQLDHLVVFARNLDDGVAWCEATLGITPTAGGEHDNYATHNRIFKIATPAFGMAYFEIIAINPNASRPKKAITKRWFDMDDSTLQMAIDKGPRLVHFVANTPDLRAARMALRMQGIDRGPAVHANRKTSKGVLHWQISVRADGARLFDGALPTLIQWGKAESTDPLKLHPRNTLPRSGVSLQSVEVFHPSADKIMAAYAAIGLQGISVHEGVANLVATLHTPKGLVKLESSGR
jgi:hypothetical protein